MPSNIPQNLRVLFWDVDFSTLNIVSHKRYIIERLLEKGDFDSLKWLFSNYSEQEIRDVIISSNNISKKTFSLWNLFFQD